MSTTPTVRPIHADEWERVRALRILAVHDPAAPVAFVDTPEQAEAYPDTFWQDRAAGGSVEAGADASARQFVAEDADGEWVGTATGLLERAGGTDIEGRPVPHDGVSVVGVWLAPDRRGAGLLGELFTAIAAWGGEALAAGAPDAGTAGAAPLRLSVHADNTRARRAYEKHGFVVVGAPYPGALGEQLELRRTADGAAATR